MTLILALLALCLAAPPAWAVRPTESARADARRFGLDKISPPLRTPPSAAARRAFGAFNSATGGRWSMRFSPRTGLPAAVVGGRDVPRPGRPEDAARQFLTAHRDLLGIDPAVLNAANVAQIDGHRHVLYRQNYRGIPVEFTAVKVHLDGQGSVIGLHSSYEPDIALPTRPSVAADAAVRAALSDLGGSAQARGAATLVIAPLETTGQSHLAWKMRVDGPGGGWRYYVDALTGRVLFRYQINKFQTCVTSGVVTGAVYDIDPSTTPGPVVRQFDNQYVYLADGSERALTGGDATFGRGFFCAGIQGKVAMSLRGPYVSVGEFRGPNAHFNNGNGVWSTVSTPVSSPHPYSNGAVAVSTIDLTLSAPSAVAFLPVFSNFAVGAFNGDITDDDRLTIYDGADNPVASYVGARGAFNGAAVHGKVMHLALRSNESGQANGYDVSVSSYLALSSPFTWAAQGSSHTWMPADSSQGLRAEMSLFYHLNKMHDYFLADVNKSSAAPISKPVVAMAHAGPDLVNAFYDPDYDDLYFGDVSSVAPSDIFADDATVPRHEYVHYLVEKIWPMQNFGQAGAISEANADYFSASSLDHSSIGTYVVAQLGGTGPLRELDDLVSPPGSYVLGTTPWTGEIHDDSLFVSQALWDIRRDRIAALGHDTGRSCADGLQFQSLLFFPESFSELYEAMLQVDSMGAVAACGGANAAHNIIVSAFNAHMGALLSSTQGDAYESDDGFETAVDISTLGAISATISPAADVDFYSFGAGPGLVQLTLSLPSAGSGVYKAYQLMLYDVRRRLVASAEPPYNGYGTVSGACDTNECQTTASSVVLSYNNPSGGLLYVQVVGGTSYNGSNSGVNSTTPYRLGAAFPQGGALMGSIVTASFDNDLIAFSVGVSTFVSNQDWRFDHAQLRDEAFAPIPNTGTHSPTASGDYLTMVSSQNAGGMIAGSVRLAPGFAARFPAVGTIYLEIFGYDVFHTTSSLGLSNAINLTTNRSELTAYNNLFNPAKGQKAIVKYAVVGAGRLTIKLYTVSGQHVATLFDDQVPAGKGAVDWDGRNSSGRTVASGIYVVRAEGPGLRTTQKIAVVK